MRQRESVEELRELLDCDIETGVLVWKVRSAKWHKVEWVCNRFNNNYAGKVAGSARGDSGYLQMTLPSGCVSNQRVVYAMHYGVWPKDHIDHINGIRDDNRPDNLRDVSNQENSRNQKKHNTNTSGFTGVYWSKGSSKWVAQITVNLKNKHLGYFTGKQEAIAARKQAELEYGFHENHGRNA